MLSLLSELYTYYVGFRRGPKGISTIALMASLLDPWIKGGVGVCPADQDSNML